MAKSVSLKDNHHNEPVTDLLLLPTCGCVFMCAALQWIGLFFLSLGHCVQQVICIFCLFSIGPRGSNGFELSSLNSVMENCHQ